ncbi:MAG: diguanylate cyclase [Candidatus Dormibacteria bacterium]
MRHRTIAPIHLDQAVTRVLFRLAGLAVVTLLVAIATNVWRSDLSSDSNRYVAATQSLDRAHAGMLDQETGLRGFLGTGDATLLERYRAGQQEVTQGDRALQSAFDNDPGLLDDYVALRLAQANWQTQWATQATALRPAATLGSYLAADQTLFDSYRVTETRLDQDLLSRVGSVDAVRATVANAGLVVKLGMLVVAAVLWWRARRELRRAVVGPIATILAGLERIEAGDYSILEPVTTGPAELRAVSERLAAVTQRLRSARDGAQQREMEAARLYEQAEERGKTDALTLLPNRRDLDRALGAEVSRAHRYHRPLAVAMIDIDHFKTVNDTQGHARGDEILREAAAVMRGGLRDVDTIYRYGGEEFLVVMPETGSDAAVELCDRLRRSVSERMAVRATAPLTVSCGVASFPSDGTDQARLIAAADLALYRAKRGGRDRVVAAGGAEVLVALARPRSA